MKKNLYWRFSRKIEGEFRIFYKRFPWKFFCSETPALVLHVLYFPLKLSLIVSEEAISPRRRPPPPEPKASEASACESEVKVKVK